MPPLLTIAYPSIDPVLIAIGPVVIRWYALAYVAGLLGGWWIMARMAERPPAPGRKPVLTRALVDDFLIWATLGVILGGRMGYVIFYQGDYFIDNPLRVFAIWRGGMSFHGGLAGVVLATILFARKRSIPILAIGDLACLVAPIGLFLGRIANFINAELYGRPSDVPWAMVFPTDRLQQPRHPSQLYEAALEGLLLFAILLALVKFAHARGRPGLISGTFMVGYGIFRSFAETFREPDIQIGFLAGGTTMGQWLSVPVFIAGLWLVVRALSRNTAGVP